MAPKASQQRQRRSKPLAPPTKPSESPPAQARISYDLFQLIRAVEFLIAAGFCSGLSQISMSPVYGSIPPTIYHNRILAVAGLLAWIAIWCAPNRSYLKISENLLPLIAFFTPTIQFFLFKRSGQFGPVYGPLITELVTCLPLASLSIFVAARLTEIMGQSIHSKMVASTGLAVVTTAIVKLSESISQRHLTSKMGSSLIFTRSGLQFITATFYALMSPSKLLVFAVFPVLHSASLNLHVPLQQTTDLLNSTLNSQNYSLLARQESLTGYLSVLDNLRDGFRVMRCDHSLLGGEWVPQPGSHALRLKEPIYSVFTMLEAVRLVRTTPPSRKPEIADKDKIALVIGLGIGTTPSALIAHGIQTTIIEIDPVVHDFASRYFDLPSNHTSIIQDATTFVQAAQANASHSPLRYDYIIHDVFTGGAEPIDLFTVEFITGLRSLLKPDGVIAINYAGDLLLPSARLIVRTVLSIFPNCRLYREDFPPTPITTSPEKDFTNMVFFCLSSSSKTFTFRTPTEADCLGSQARRYHMLPRHEIDVGYFDRRDEDGEGDVLTTRNRRSLEKYQRESAVGHWHIMRTVLPDWVWEAY